MTRLKHTFFLVIIIISFLVPSYGTQAQKSSALIIADIGLASYTATGNPFDRSPFLQVGMIRFLTDQVGAGILYSFSRWNDYLGMFGGKYTFNVDKLSLEFNYFFNLKHSLFIRPFAGINLGYNFITVRNELGNQYEGDLKNHFSFAPFLGVYLNLGRSDDNFWKNFALTAKIYWYTNGQFSGLNSTVGMFIKIK